MLPDFPKVKQNRYDFVSKVAYAKAMNDETFLSKMQPRCIPEGNNFQSTSEDGFKDGGLEKIEIEVFTKFDELPLLDDVQLIKKLYEQQFKPLFDAQMKIFLRKMDQVTASTGNIINAKNKSHEESILEALTQISWSFDENGEEIPTTLLVGKKLYNELTETAGCKKEFEEAYCKIRDKKRIEWRLEQADRKLVD